MTTFRCFILLSCLLLIGCSSPGIGYGVILWSPSQANIPHGSLVVIKSEKRSEKMYRILYKTQEMEVNTWRVSFFHLHSEAKAESERLERVRNLFAESLKGDLPVRSSQDNYTNNNILYRLGENEIAKVLREPSDEITLGNLKGRWYEVLTQTGYQGFVFDYYLYVFDRQSQAESSEETLEVDPIKAKLNSWANKTWYPLYYSFMTRHRAIVLPLFNLSYGLAFLPHQKLILVTLPEVQLQFSYVRTQSENGNEITFVEPDLRIEEINSQELKLHFTYEGQAYVRTFIIFAGDIKALRDRQEKIIQKLQNDLYTKRRFSSPSAGLFSLDPNGTYTWKEGSSLGNLLPASWGENHGSFDLNKTMVSPLQTFYKGVITLHPAGTHESEGKREPLTFLLDYSENFLQLTYVPTHNLKHDVVTKGEINSPTFTFTRSETLEEEKTP